MYPYFRIAKELWKIRKAEPLEFGEPHISHHRCWPSDIDFWMELNNGRTLTLMDLGRIPMAKRAGMIDALKANGWGLTVAGVSVRYRRRIGPFEAFSMRSRAVCWDERFFYLEQCIVKRSGEVANHALYRVAVTDKSGIVAPALVADAMGQNELKSEIPDWIANWIEAEATRPWPPMQD